jgi:hypothetical protein
MSETAVSDIFCWNCWFFCFPEIACLAKLAGIQVTVSDLLLKETNHSSLRIVPLGYLSLVEKPRSTGHSS